MNSPRRDSDPRWERLVSRARADVAPPGNVAPVLARLRGEPLHVEEGWIAAFVEVFATGRMVTGCLAGASAITVAAAWEAFAWWRALPWAQWVAVGSGGGL